MGMISRLRTKAGIWRPEWDMVSMQGKVVVCTGGNSGIGFQVVKWLAAKGAHVIMAVRDPAGAGSKAVRDINREVRNARVQVMELDMASFRSIKKFVQDFKALELPIHVLLNMAGEFMNVPRPTEDGFMWVMGINYFGACYLTHLLLDDLKRSQPSRIINTSSILGEVMSQVDWEDIRGDKLMRDNEDGLLVYARAKLMLSMFTSELNKKLMSTGVDVFAVQPGYVGTNIFRKGDPRKFLTAFFKIGEEHVAQHCYYGALPALMAASEPKITGEGGQYFGPAPLTMGFFHTRSRKHWNPDVYDEQKCAKLFGETTKIITEVARGLKSLPEIVAA